MPETAGKARIGNAAPGREKDDHAVVPAGRSGPKRTVRLHGEDRRQIILYKSISYFSKYGFEGGTRNLAKEIGVTQPLLYKYFPSKADLIDAVFEELYERQRRHQWDIALSDRSRPIADRLNEFFSLYAERTYSSEWIRIYTFAGLLDGTLNRRHIQKVANPIMRLICSEVHYDMYGRDRATDDITQHELDILWLLHGGIYYFYVRSFVYNEDVGGTLAALVRDGVDQALASLRNLYRHQAPTER